MIISPAGLPITGVIFMASVVASVKVENGVLSYAGQYDIEEDRLLVTEDGQALFVDSAGGEFYQGEIDFGSVTVDLPAPNS